MEKNNAGIVVALVGTVAAPYFSIAPDAPPELTLRWE